VCSSDLNQKWTVADEWNRWVLVENLAADPEAIEQLSKEYINIHRRSLLGFHDQWNTRMDQWIAS